MRHVSCTCARTSTCQFLCDIYRNHRKLIFFYQCLLPLHITYIATITSLKWHEMFVSYHLSTLRATVWGQKKEIWMIPFIWYEIRRHKVCTSKVVGNNWRVYGQQGANNKGGGKWRGISPVQSACQIAVHFKMPRAVSEPLAPRP